LALSSPLSIKESMKRKNKITNREVIKQLDVLTKIALSNKSSLTILSDFLYNYLEMKGDTEKYTKFMKERIDDILTEGKQGINKVSGESIPKEEKEEKE
jgi:hypothetical protein